ncbi:MAG: ribonuclease T [Pseudomonadota bacterium]
MEFAERFRGYLPVVVDLETGGFDRDRNPLLEIGCTFLNWSDDTLSLEDSHAWNVEPFCGSEADPASLKITGIDLDDPERNAMPEKEALQTFFKLVRQRMKQAGCRRAVLVAHNAAFDQGFLLSASERSGIKRSPFHPFTAIDTASLAAVAYGHTVLSEACRRAGIVFENASAHRAAYDAEQTARLFCKIVNAWPYDVAFDGPHAAPSDAEQAQGLSDPD